METLPYKSYNETVDKFSVKLAEMLSIWAKLRILWNVKSIYENPLDAISGENNEIKDFEEKISSIFIELLNSKGVDRELLYQSARNIRDEKAGRKIEIRGVIEASNICRGNCLYCPMRRDNLPLTDDKQRITPKQIYEQALSGAKAGIRHLFIQSGEDPQVVPIVVHALELIKNDPKMCDVEIVLNLGDQTMTSYTQLHKAGADGYLIKHETSDEELHKILRPHSTIKQRISQLLQARQVGMFIGTGVIIGLPGQTDKVLAKDIILAGRVASDKMVSCSPFTPDENIPLAGKQAGDFYKTLNMIAIYRHLFPTARIPAVSNLDSVKLASRPTDSKISGQSAGINAGANGISINLTPPEIRNSYRIYASKKRHIVDWTKAEQISKETGLPLALTSEPEELYYSNVKRFIFNSFNKVKESYQIKHSIRTAYWVKKLKFDADEALLIAAIAHDIERAFRQKDVSERKYSKGFRDLQFLHLHEERGAEIIGNFLKIRGAPARLIERVKILVEKHDEGGSDDQNLLRDADSISFFENNISFFLEKELLKMDKKKIRQKFNWMFNRIGSGKARQIAQPFYEKAIDALDANL